MKAKEIRYYQLELSDEERTGIYEAIKAVNDGEGGIDDYPILKQFYSVLSDLGAIS